VHNDDLLDLFMTLSHNSYRTLAAARLAYKVKLGYIIVRSND